MVELIQLDARITSITAVRLAMYRLSTNLGLVCRLDGDQIIVESHAPLNDTDLALLMRHVNDYQLREIIGQRTSPMRDAILAVALLRVTEQRDDS